MTVTLSAVRLGILDLVQASGVPRRTIRYYVQVGLLPRPKGAGRGHYYEQEHLERLVRIRDLRDRGRSIETIRSLLDGDSEEVPIPQIEIVTRILVAPGLEVVVGHGAKPPTPSQVNELARAAARILSDEKTSKEPGHPPGKGESHD